MQMTLHNMFGFHNYSDFLNPINSLDGNDKVNFEFSCFVYTLVNWSGVDCTVV